MKKIIDSLTNDRPSREDLENQRLLVEHRDDPEVGMQLESLFNSLEPEESEDDASLESHYLDLVDKLGISGKWRMHRTVSSILKWGTRAAAILAIPLAVAVGMLVASRPEPVEWTEITVPYGQTRNIALADGSTMVLNPGSRLVYPSGFQGKERVVFLDGEVSAQISKDPDRPFVIRSGDQSVVVHGTKFDFKNYSTSECAELLLKEGAVSFGYSNEGMERLVRLSPGEMLQFDKESYKLEINPFPAEEYKSYGDNGAIRFNNLKMSDIAKDLERRFDVKIVIADEKIANTRYLAFFTNHESLEQILKAISDNNRNMKIDRKEGVFYLSSRR